jgi:hypothetical protein
VALGGDDFPWHADNTSIIPRRGVEHDVKKSAFCRRIFDGDCCCPS